MDVPDDHQSPAIPPSSSTEGKTPQRRSAGQLRRKISSATKTTYSRRVHSTKVVHTKRLSRGSTRARGVTSKVKRNYRRTNKHPPPRRTPKAQRQSIRTRPFPISEARSIRRVRSEYKRNASPCSGPDAKRFCSAERIRCHADALQSDVCITAAAASVTPSIPSQRLPSNRGHKPSYARRPYKPRSAASRRQASSFRARYKSNRSKLKAYRHLKRSPSVDLTNKESQEAFIKHFAIPTHLYRYLAARHRQQPLYLDRTLSYLRAPSTFSTGSVPNGTTYCPSRPSVDAIANRLWQEKRLSSTNHMSDKCCKMGNCVTTDDRLDPSNELCSFSTSVWPHEVQLVFEGFFDSEKELDWVTVEASLIPSFRFAWAWRHKAASADTLVSPFGEPFPLACHNPTTGLNHLPLPASVDSCRFQPSEVIKQAKWATSGGRLSAGQLELRIHAIERRWLKRPDLNRTNSTASLGSGCYGCNGLQTNTVSNHRLSGNPQCNRKGGLGSSAYPVHYTTAPLPLFYSAVASGSQDDHRPFLLTPGMYELRLGVDHNAGNHLPVKPTPTPETPTVCKQNGMLENGYYDHQHNHHHHHPSETGSTADSVATSSSDCPTGTVSSAGEVTSMSEAGSVCGRVEWRRMRLPKESETSDEYTRWPKLRFRILWRGKTACDSPTSHRDQVNGALAADARSPPYKALSHTPNNISPRKLPRNTSLTRTSATPSENGTPRRSAVKSPCKPDPFSQIVPNTPDTPQSKATTRPRKPSTRPYLLDRAVLPDRPVTYGFFYLGRLQQWSESNDFRCPWCRLDCWRARERAPEALLIHLRTCHPRFRFKASWSSSRSHLTLEVSLNEAYDGSNDCGLRRWSYELTNNLNGRWSVPRGQLIGGWTGLGLFGGGEQANKSLSLAGSSARVPCPVRRLPYTHLIFWRGAERVNDQPFDPTLSVRPIATGHNRVYYHTRTMQPIRACEFDVDSEAEDSPVWLWQHYQRKLEEFTDVNQGEKQIMQLWNSLLLSLGPSELITCDSQLANVASCFVHRFASQIYRRHLRTNMILHFTNLVDYGLLSTGQMRQLVITYDNLVSSSQQPENTT